MVVDAELWLLFACTVAFLVCGCLFTAPRGESLKLRDNLFDD
jgi:hypothetical protein